MLTKTIPGYELGRQAPLGKRHPPLHEGGSEHPIIYIFRHYLLQIQNCSALAPFMTTRSIFSEYIYNLSQFSPLLQLFPSLDKVQGLGEVLHRGLGVLVVQGADGVLAQLLCPGHLVIGQGS